MNSSKTNLSLLSMLGGLLIAGCNTPDTRIQDNPEAFSWLTPHEQALVKAGEVGIGFDLEAVKLALGDPDRVTDLTTALGRTVAWHYPVYEADGVFLYTGYYFRRHARWGLVNPYYLDYPNRIVRDRLVVEFKDDKVIAISKDMAD